MAPRRLSEVMTGARTAAPGAAGSACRSGRASSIASTGSRARAAPARTSRGGASISATRRSPIGSRSRSSGSGGQPVSPAHPWPPMRCARSPEDRARRLDPAVVPVRGGARRCRAAFRRPPRAADARLDRRTGVGRDRRDRDRRAGGALDDGEVPAEDRVLEALGRAIAVEDALHREPGPEGDRRGPRQDRAADPVLPADAARPLAPRLREGHGPRALHARHRPGRANPNAAAGIEGPGSTPLRNGTGADSRAEPGRIVRPWLPGRGNHGRLATGSRIGGGPGGIGGRRPDRGARGPSARPARCRGGPSRSATGSSGRASGAGRRRRGARPAPGRRPPQGRDPAAVRPRQARGGAGAGGRPCPSGRPAWPGSRRRRRCRPRRRPPARGRPAPCPGGRAAGRSGPASPPAGSAPRRGPAGGRPDGCTSRDPRHDGPPSPERGRRPRGVRITPPPGGRGRSGARSHRWDGRPSSVPAVAGPDVLGHDRDAAEGPRPEAPQLDARIRGGRRDGDGDGEVMHGLDARGPPRPSAR